jgi:hypothetical protein
VPGRCGTIHGVTDTADRAPALVLRPSTRAPRARRQLIEATVFGVVISLVVGAVSLAAAFPLGWLLIAFCAAWYGLLPWLYFRNATLYVDRGRVGKTDLFGRRTEVDAGRVAAVRVISSGPGSHRIVVEDAGGLPLLRVYATAWRVDQVEQLRAALAVPVGPHA